MYRALCFLQGIYYLLTGLWPLIHMSSFLYVTGPKTDLWLVRTVAGLIVATGIALLGATRDRFISSAVILLGLTSALALFTIDVVYVFSDVIDGVYLLDAGPELLLAIGWLIVARRPATVTVTDRGEPIQGGVLPPNPVR